MNRFILTALAVLVVFPVIALAQTLAQESTGFTFRGFDLTPILSGLVLVIGAAFAWVSKKIAAANTATAANAGASTALLKLGNIGFSMAGDLWSQFSVEFQKRIADGKIDADDREYFRLMVKQNIEKYTSAEELKKIADALGLPLPGIIARVAEYIIDRLTKAHDPVIEEVSDLAYPVKAPEGTGGYGG